MQLLFMMLGSQSELLESSYDFAQKLLHDNITLIDDDASRAKAELNTDNHQLKRCILVASAEYLSAESTDEGFGQRITYLNGRSK